MPEATQKSIYVAGEELFVGKKYHYDALSLSKEKIVEYATYCDPLPIHIDEAFAKQSRFGGIIASGTQLFAEFHKRDFIPVFGKSIVAGLVIHNWRFLLPTFPDQPIHGTLEVLGIEPKLDKGVAVVHWQYLFFTASGERMQQADFQIMVALDV